LRVELVDVSTCHEGGCTGFGERLCNLPAEQPSASGDEGNLPFEIKQTLDMHVASGG